MGCDIGPGRYVAGGIRTDSSEEGAGAEWVCEADVAGERGRVNIKAYRATYMAGTLWVFPIFRRCWVKGIFVIRG